MLRIVSDDGTPLHTRVIDDASGEDITRRLGIHSIRVTVMPGQLNQADIITAQIALDLRTSSVEWVMSHPMFRKYAAVRTVVFRDGSTATFKTDGSVDMQGAPDADRP